MARRKRIVSRARDNVRELLRGHLPRWILYHSYQHTVEVVRATTAIGKASRLSDSDIEVLLLAAWFHDTGFIKSAAGHERISATLASDFLRAHQYPEKRITRVASCILATKMPRNPRNLLERILCDADLVSLGKRSFFKQNEALRLETESRKGRAIGQLAWLRRSLHFLEHTRYSSRSARLLYESQRQANLRRLRNELRKLELNGVRSEAS